MRNGANRLTDSNMYPVIVGAADRTPILTKLLTPIAVPVSLGSTIPDAKDWRIGLENMSVSLRTTKRSAARGYKLVRMKTTVRTVDNIRDKIRVPTSPSFATAMGMNG